MFSSSIEILQKRVNKQQVTTWKGVFDMCWLLTGCSSFLLFLEPLLFWRLRSQMEFYKKERKLSRCLKAEPSEYEWLLNYLRKVHEGHVTSQPDWWEHLGAVLCLIPWSALKKPLGWEEKHLTVAFNRPAKSSLDLQITLTWMNENIRGYRKGYKKLKKKVSEVLRHGRLNQLLPGHENTGCQVALN